MRALTRFLSIASCLISLVFLLACFLGPVVDIGLWGKLLLPAFAVGSLMFPQYAFALLLLLLPILGNKPGSPQAMFLTLLCGAFVLGASLQLCLGRASGLGSKEEGAFAQNPVFVLLLSYVLVSILSVTGLPFHDLSNVFSHLFLSGSWTEFLISSELLMVGPETSLEYSLFSICTNVIAFSAAYLGVRLMDRGRSNLNLYSTAILLSLGVSVVGGFLDYYGVLSLLWLRELDPVANINGVQFRMQSFFGHSGWFAEFLTLSVPFVIYLMNLRWRFAFRVLLILLILLVIEIALILSYQRGGWLSYPLTLVAVWTAIYISYRTEKGDTDLAQSLKRSVWKVLLSLPLTVLVSAGVVYFLQGSEVQGPEGKRGLATYVNRFASIQRVGDRSFYIMSGFDLGSLHPFLGGGSESYGFQFEREVDSPQGALYGKYKLPYHGSAHNVYAQTFAGKGLCGLLLLLSIPLSIVGLCLYKLVRGMFQTKDELFANMIGACFSCGFLVYGLVQEIFYVQSLQLLFFVVVLLSCKGLSFPRLSRRLQTICLYFIVVCLGAHLFWEYALPGHARAQLTDPRPYGCFAGEQTPEGKVFRWCGPASALHLAREQGQQRKTLKINLHPLASRGGKAELGIRVCGKQDTIVLTPGTLQELDLDLSACRPEALDLVAEFELSAYFIPGLVIDGSRDFRRLSYQIE